MSQKLLNVLLASSAVLLPVVGAVLIASPACVRQPTPGPVITSRWTDNFDRESPGSEWFLTGPQWSIDQGALRVQGARNHPIWLRRRLPRNVHIEFDAWSSTDEGDIKCEVFGDGRSHAVQDSYTATSYVVIFGGWHNQLNVIARMDEHAPNRRVRRGPHVVPNQHYHWVVERRGNVLSWSLDGAPMLEFNDPEPLEGRGHEFFAFNNWMVELHFDNLVIQPL